MSEDHSLRLTWIFLVEKSVNFQKWCRRNYKVKILQQRQLLLECHQWPFDAASFQVLLSKLCAKICFAGCGLCGKLVQKSISWADFCFLCIANGWTQQISTISPLRLKKCSVFMGCAHDFFRWYKPITPKLIGLNIKRFSYHLICEIKSFPSS